VIAYQQVIVRVPRPQTRGPGTQVRWREGPGPRCVWAQAIAGALPGEETVDILLKGDRRVRARLRGRCRGLTYYRGLYLTADRKGQICARRDAVRSRMGGHCQIVEFRALRPIGR